MEYGCEGVMSLRLKPEIGIYILSFMSVFVNLSNYIPVYNYVRYAMLVVLGLFVCVKVRFIFSVHHRAIYYLWIVFAFVVLLSSFLNRNEYTERNSFLASIVFFGGLIEMLAVVHYAMLKTHLVLLMDVFYWLGLILLTINDVMLFAVIPSDNYLVGNKFSVMYFHMLVIALWLFRVFRLHKEYYVNTVVAGLILFILSFISGLRVNCMTGVVGLIVMVLWTVIGAKTPRLVNNPITALCAVLFSYLFMYVASVILNVPFISRIIEQVFQHDSTLSMRTEIYQVVPDIIAKHPILGYGYGVSYLVLTNTHNGFIPDTQNGLAEWLLFGGLAAGIVLVIMIVYIFRCVATTNEWNLSLNILVAIAYAFISMATIEVTYSEEFFTILMLIYVFAISGTFHSDDAVLERRQIIR